uniref:Uncharacterized protein n=1 Tax=Calidris pygmaea TaxID=425635 RepID=A0A8C3PRU7_9CHAR
FPGSHFCGVQLVSALLLSCSKKNWGKMKVKPTALLCSGYSLD